MADLEWQDVKSTNVGRESRTTAMLTELIIQFRSGAVYAYPSAGEAAYQDIIVNPSPGSYVNRWLKGQPARRVK